MSFDNRVRLVQSPVEVAVEKAARAVSNCEIGENDGLLAARQSPANKLMTSVGSSSEASLVQGALLIPSIDALLETAIGSRSSRKTAVDPKKVASAVYDGEKSVTPAVCENGICHTQLSEGATKSPLTDVIKLPTDKPDESNSYDASSGRHRAGKHVVRGPIITPGNSFKTSDFKTDEEPLVPAAPGPSISAGMPIMEERRPGQGKPGDPGYRRGISDSTDYADWQHDDGGKSGSMVYHGANSAMDCFNDAKSRGVKVIVVESADWCGPCKRLHKDVLPLIEDAYQGKVAILNLNADTGSDQKLMKQLGGRGGLPAMLVGTPVVSPGGELTLDKRQPRNGFISAHDLVEFINAHIDKNSPSYLKPDLLPNEKRRRFIRRRDEE